MRTSPVLTATSVARVLKQLHEQDLSAAHMKILMLNYEFPPLGGGTANANFYLLREYAKHEDLVVDLVTSSASNRFEVEQFSPNIRIYKLNVRKKDVHYWRMSEIAWWLWKAYWMSRKLVKKGGYDLCHCWSGWPAGMVGWTLRRKMPYVVALRGSDIPGWNPRLEMLDKYAIRYVSKVVWGRASAVTTLSEYSSLRASVTRQCDFKVIHNGVDTEDFYPAAGLSDTLRVLTVGRLAEYKGARYAILGVKEFLDRSSDRKIHLTIVGSGPLESELKSLSSKFGLNDVVTFLGVVDHGKLPEIYRANDVFLIPALHEAMGNVTLEAIASGLAIVTTDTGKADPLDGNGLIVEPADATDVADKLAALAGNRELLARFKRRSAELAKTISWTRCCEAYLDLCRKVLA